MSDSHGSDWWRPHPGSKWDYRVTFLATAIGIAGGTLTLAAVTWGLASTNDGRIKALLWWAIGVTAAGAFVIFRLIRREHKDVRYGRALSSTHMAHHQLRDAAFGRYIAREPEADWSASVEAALRDFATAFTIATNAPCHATVKRVVSPPAVNGVRTEIGALEILTLYRTASRPPTLRAGIPKNTVGLNTDFRHLFRPDEAGNRCWYHNDLLTADLYDNPHWPADPNPKSVPYRATMVWPIRKVLRSGTATRPSELFIFGFLTIDTPEPGVLDYERHFHLGAGFADHLMSVLWDPGEIHEVLVAMS